jgi:hypothetical protein
MEQLSSIIDDGAQIDTRPGRQRDTCGAGLAWDPAADVDKLRNHVLDAQLVKLIPSALSYTSNW